MFNDEVISFIKSLYPHEDFIPLHAPVLDDHDRKGVIDAIDSGFVSSVGPHVTQFEEDLAKFTGAAKAVAVVNGTAALHLAMLVSGVQENDLVITQALTFVATANAISYIGAKPVFLDSDEETLGLSPSALKKFLNEHAVKKDGQAFHKTTGQRIASCIPMHVFGHPVKIFELIDICQKWGISVIEDAAEALGSKISGKSLGTIAPVGVLSFNGNKIITTGGGGAILFQDEKMALKAKHLSTTAKVPHRWEFCHDEIGYNYRMPNLNAALGCAQLKRLPSFLETKAIIANKYKNFFSNYSSVKFLSGSLEAEPNWWLNAILVSDLEERNEWLAKLNDAGVMTRPVWELMPNLPIYKDCLHDDLIIARSIQDRLINLPSGVPK